MTLTRQKYHSEQNERLGQVYAFHPLSGGLECKVKIGSGSVASSHMVDSSAHDEK